MLDCHLGLRDHVVHKHLHRLSYMFLKQLVHQTLVSGANILETERHYLVTVKVLPGDKTGLVLVGGMHHDLVVP